MPTKTEPQVATVKTQSCYYTHIVDGVKKLTCIECERFSVTVRPFALDRLTALEWMNEHTNGHLAEHPARSKPGIAT